jgi:hypothetical protein
MLFLAILVENFDDETFRTSTEGTEKEKLKNKGYITKIKAFFSRV